MPLFFMLTHLMLLQTHKQVNFKTSRNYFFIRVTSINIVKGSKIAFYNVLQFTRLSIGKKATYGKLVVWSF